MNLRSFSKYLFYQTRPSRVELLEIMADLREEGVVQDFYPEVLDMYVHGYSSRAIREVCETVARLEEIDFHLSQWSMCLQDYATLNTLESVLYFFMPVMHSNSHFSTGYPYRALQICEDTYTCYCKARSYPYLSDGCEEAIKLFGFIKKWIRRINRRSEAETLRASCLSLVKKMRTLAEEVAGREDWSNKAVLILGRDCEMLYRMTCELGMKNCYYVEISRLVIDNQYYTINSLVPSILRMAEGREIVIIDTGFSGTIFRCLEGAGLAIEGYLLSSNGSYPTLGSLSRPDVRALEDLPKAATRATLLDENLQVAHRELCSSDSGKVDIAMYRYMYRYLCSLR